MSKIFYNREGIDDLIRYVLDAGVTVKDPRTGSITKALFDAKLIIEEGEFPWVNNHLASPRLAFEEIMFFLRGDTDTKKLEAYGVNFWKGNTSTEFQKKVGLDYLMEGELGSCYSMQWRGSGQYRADIAKATARPHINNSGEGDQLKTLIDGIINDRYGRRNLVTLWNPSENKHGVLTPCWHSMQVVILPNDKGEDVMHMKLSNRSLDTVFGAKFALMQYRMLQMMLASMIDVKVGILSADLSQIHVYENQYEYAQEMVDREYIGQDECEIRLKDRVSITSMETLLEVEWDDWHHSYVYNKKKFDNPRPEMVS